MNMTNNDDRLLRIEQMVDELAARLAALEQGSPPPSAEPYSSDGFADRLQQRLMASDEDVTGLIAYAGAVRAPEGELVLDFERSAGELLTRDMEPVAQALAALGHTVRLDLMRLLLRGPQTSQQLQEALGLASSGPLYYHLKELMASGLVIQPARNSYQVSLQRVVPLLVILSAGIDLRGG
jgi:DNA-binding HxlR family transcriptional regulator